MLPSNVAIEASRQFRKLSLPRANNSERPASSLKCERGELRAVRRLGDWLARRAFRCTHEIPPHSIYRPLQSSTVLYSGCATALCTPLTALGHWRVSHAQSTSIAANLMNRNNWNGQSRLLKRFVCKMFVINCNGHYGRLSATRISRDLNLELRTLCDHTSSSYPTVCRALCPIVSLCRLLYSLPASRESRTVRCTSVRRHLLPIQRETGQRPRRPARWFVTQQLIIDSGTQPALPRSNGQGMVSPGHLSKSGKQYPAGCRGIWLDLDHRVNSLKAQLERIPFRIFPNFLELFSIFPCLSVSFRAFPSVSKSFRVFSICWKHLWGEPGWLAFGSHSDIWERTNFPDLNA